MTAIELAVHEAEVRMRERCAAAIDALCTYAGPVNATRQDDAEAESYDRGLRAAAAKVRNVLTSDLMPGRLWCPACCNVPGAEHGLVPR